MSFGSFRRDARLAALQPPDPARRTVLVIPEAYLTESEALFSFALRLATLLPDHRFIFRCHPALPFEQVRPQLSDAPERHANVELSTQEIAHDYARASAVLYRGSSAVLYAVQAGLKPLYFHDARHHDIDPLYELSQWRQRVTAPDEAAEMLAQYAGTTPEQARSAWREAADYVHAYSAAIDERSVDRLLQATGLGETPSPCQR